MAVDGTKDQVATADDVSKGYAKNVGDPIYQGIDHSKMVPVLTAALQEAITKIETLEAKVAALEEAITKIETLEASLREIITKVEKLEQDNIALRARVTNLEDN